MSYDNSFSDNFDDLNSYASDLEPRHAFLPDIEALQDGDYVFQVLSAKLERARNNDPIVKAELRPDRGPCVQHTWWLSRQESVNGFYADMMALQLAREGWGRTGRHLKLDIEDAVKRLPGVVFSGSKRTDVSKKDGKIYTKLSVNGLAARATVMPPSSNGVVPPMAPPQVAAQAQRPPAPALNQAEQEGMIPF